jgi:hypothetical protein
MVRHTQQAIYLDDGEIAVVEARSYRCDHARRGAIDQTADHAPVVDDNLSKGAFQPLHDEGNPRTARLGARHAARPHRSAFCHGAAATA